MNVLPHFDRTWSLFLDRDGVINIEKENDYIRHADELMLYPKAPQAIAMFNAIFKHVLVVTNQRGIGKGLMSETDLTQIHQRMDEYLKQANAHIEAYYFAPQLNNDAEDRKPNPGMGYQAKRQFPDIDFNKSVMVGNNLSDMGFGRNLGMFTVYVNTTSPRTENHPDIDWYCKDLHELAQYIQQHQTR